MEIKKSATAGTVESSDIMITVAPNEESGIAISLDSSVENQFGKQIKEQITSILNRLNVNNVTVTAVDKGALECTIKARLLTAVYRACDDVNYDWKEVDSWND